MLGKFTLSKGNGTTDTSEQFAGQAQHARTSMSISSSFPKGDDDPVKTHRAHLVEKTKYGIYLCIHLFTSMGNSTLELKWRGQARLRQGTHWHMIHHQHGHRACRCGGAGRGSRVRAHSHCKIGWTQPPDAPMGKQTSATMDASVHGAVRQAGNIHATQRGVCEHMAQILGGPGPHTKLLACVLMSRRAAVLAAGRDDTCGGGGGSLRARARHSCQHRRDVHPPY